MMNPRPNSRVVAIEIKPLVKSWLNIRHNGGGGTLRLTDATVDALVWMNDQHILAFVETLYRTNLHTIHVLACDAVLGHDISHHILQGYGPAGCGGNPRLLR